LYAQTTPRGSAMIMLLAFVLLLALASGESVLYRLSYFLALVVVVGYAWTRVNLSRLRMWVEEQATVAQVGDTLEGSIYVCNESPLPSGWIEIVQVSDMPGDVCGGAAELPPRGWEAWKAERFCCARGVYTIGPLVARGSDPLGLFRAQKTEGDVIKAVVYPPVVELPYFGLPVAGLSGNERVVHRPETRSSHAGTVREYSPGDSLNRIHWPSTARRGQLMSKEFDSGGYGEVWIVLDLEQEVQESAGMEKTDEYAVAAAASLANLALAEERSTGLIAYGDQDYILPLGSGTKQMSRVLETLARSRTEGEVPLSDVLSLNATRFGRFASVLVVTSSTDTEWVSLLLNLAFRGLNIVVVLVDPASFGGDRSRSQVVTELVSAGIPAYVIRKGDLLPLALSLPVRAHDLSLSEQPGVGELMSTAGT